MLSDRAQFLADRVEAGFKHLEEVAANLTDAQWETHCDGEQRTVGVLVHHVASAYPLEAAVMRTFIDEGGMPGLNWDAVNPMNAEHAQANAKVDKATTLAMLRENGHATAEAVRGVSDAQLDQLAPNQLHWGAPLTVQFWIEHHPIAHPYIHIESIKAALGS